MPDKFSRRPSISYFLSLRRRDDLLAGFFFVLVGSVALLIALDYPMGTSTRMLAGYVPRLISGLLILAGLAIAVQSGGDQADVEEGKPSNHWRATLFVPLGMLVFGGTIETLGLVPAVFVTVIALAFAETKKRWVETLTTAVVLSTLVYLIFIQALGFSMLVFPRF